MVQVVPKAYLPLDFTAINRFQVWWSENTSPKSIDREGLGGSCTGTGHGQQLLQNKGYQDSQRTFSLLVNRFPRR